MKVKLVCGLLLACAELYCPDRGLEMISPELMVDRLQHEVEQLREQLVQALEQASQYHQGWLVNYEAVVQLFEENKSLTEKNAQQLETINKCNKRIEELDNENLQLIHEIHQLNVALGVFEEQ